MTTIEKINKVKELERNTPNGEVIDADTILTDLVESVDFAFSGFADDIFEIYKYSADPSAVCKMFYEFTDMAFEDYLDKCIAETTR